jgi:Protein of unknown function (DUF664)
LPAEPASWRLHRADPFADWPKDDVAAAGERTTVIGFLDYLRAVLARKAEGLTDEQARTAACPPSDLTILGLVRHLAEVEREWAQQSMMGRAVDPIYGGESADLHPPAEATLSDALARYWTEIDAADRIYAELPLDEIERSKRANYSLRWILVHLVEEYSRHCGHADLIRQALDGATGD